MNNSANMDCEQRLQSNNLKDSASILTCHNNNNNSKNYNYNDDSMNNTPNNIYRYTPRSGADMETESNKSLKKESKTTSNKTGSTLTWRSCYGILILLTLLSPAYSCGPGRGIGGPRKNRKLTPLVFKQHVPNMSEKTLGASGLSEGAITRNSSKFKDLVPNYSKDIIFKDEEGTGADRLMTRRCKEKLNTLAISVLNQWPGVRLRVVESWDEDNMHGNHSLHYEGRAVDITTSDRDRTKYGMLARLAVEAGFDWVYYESRGYIHCSVKSDSSQTTHVSGCFTPNSTVLTESGERKQMIELDIGDRVLSMDERGEPIYSEVILFMDRNLEQQETFVQMRTDGGAILTVTPSHLVMIWNPVKNLMDYIFADRVQEGDFLFVNDINSHLRPQRVVELSAVRRTGVVAPLTREGTIVVNSVVASCYAVVSKQSLAHWSLAPIRLMATIKSWLPFDRHQVNEISNEIDGSSSRTSEHKRQNGVHWYTKMLYHLKDYVVPIAWQHQ